MKKIRKDNVFGDRMNSQAHSVRSGKSAADRRPLPHSALPKIPEIAPVLQKKLDSKYHESRKVDYPYHVDSRESGTAEIRRNVIKKSKDPSKFSILIYSQYSQSYF
jgi:hypothetical protein